MAATKRSSRSAEDAQKLALLSDRGWRLENLYWIKDKDAKRVQFKPNWAQQRCFDHLAHKNIELKVRQLGITTGYCVLWLDLCLFSKDVAVGIVAHTKDDAKVIFRDKVKFAYDNLPEDLRQAVYPVKETESELILSNGSSIRVGVTFRSGTVQVLHVTEYGYICAKHPARAEEIKTGAFEAVPKDGITVVESTAKGRAGHFYDLCQDSQKKADGADHLAGDWRFGFLPWWEHPEYRIDEPRFIFTQPELVYFGTLETKIGRKLDAAQRVWYARKWRDLGDSEIKREYPSTPEEAFMATTEGAYYGELIMAAHRAGRVTKVPYDPSLLVETWWDIGVGDSTSIWFIQRHGLEVRCVDFYENSGEGLNHYAAELDKRRTLHKFIYGRHIGPHDLTVREFGAVDAKTRLKSAEELGIKFEVAPNLPIMDGIDAVRRLLPMVWFDEERTAEGLKCLEHYRKEWDPVRGCWKDQPLHDWTSHASDAFRTGAMMGHNLIAARNTQARPVTAARWR